MNCTDSTEQELEQMTLLIVGITSWIELVELWESTGFSAKPMLEFVNPNFSDELTHLHYWNHLTENFLLLIQTLNPDYASQNDVIIALKQSLLE